MSDLRSSLGWRRMGWAIVVLPCAAMLMGWDCGGGGTESPWPPYAHCDCYLSSECGDGNICGVNGCDPAAKLDGQCRRHPGTGGIDDPPIFESPSNRAAETLNLIFASYEAAAQAPDGGRADPALWDQVYATALSHEWAILLISVAHHALEVTLGFDFQFVPPELVEDTSNARGNIRGAPDEALAMLRATRDALIAGVLARDPRAPAGPLSVFWRTHPDYQPDHTGRCYPHGHHGLVNINPQACQLDYMTRSMQQLMPLLAP